MWRATLHNGLVVEHDGNNSPQEFLHDIKVFEVLAPSGKVAAVLRPGEHERVVFRHVRATNGATTWTEGVKAGYVDRSTGEVRVRFFNGAVWGPETQDVTPTGVEVG